MFVLSWLQAAVVLILWFSGCMLLNTIITSGRFNHFWLKKCRRQASKLIGRELVDAWIDEHVCNDAHNEVMWSDLAKAIRKGTGVRVSSDTLRGIMYEKGYMTISNQVIDTYIFNIKYKTNEEDVNNGSNDN